MQPIQHQIFKPEAQPRHVPAFVGKWLERGRLYDVPQHVAAWFEREDALATLRANPADDYDESEHDDCERLADSYRDRRAAERKLADAIDSWNSTDPLIAELPERMRRCRQHGTVGRKPGGEGLVIAWDQKCHLSHLCPDEAREEQRRVVGLYLPAMWRWKDASQLRRLQYAVLTLPNAAPGTLADAQREIYARLKSRILKASEPIPEHERTGRKRTRPAFPSIHGALCCVEAPLSSRRDWNVHVNVFLAVHGPLDWAKLRAAWGYDIEIQALPQDEHALHKALMEAIKYSVQQVPEKSAAKAGTRALAAPAVSEWTEREFAEWFRAQRGYRRLRSYGDLYGLKQPQAKLATSAIQWIGTLDWCPLSAAYRVGLVMADKFSGSRGESGPTSRAQGPPRPFEWVSA